MKTKQSRRLFLKKGTSFCIACTALAASPGLKAMSSFLDDEEIPDPKKLEYCGYTCPKECPMFVATQNNDVSAKKEAFEKWKLEERYGLSFEADKVFCYKCKPGDKPVGIAAQHCEVRNCAIKNGYDCCIECNELKNCEKGVFQRFPDFHKGVIQLQEKYLAARKA
jgi:hypothetical protein